MKLKKDKAIIIFAVVFELLLVITGIVNYMNGVKRNAFVAALSIFCVPIPFLLSYFARKKSISLPASFNFVVLGFLFSTQYLGELVGFYYTLWWWDLLLHGFAGMYAVVVGIYLTKGIIKKEKGVTDRRFLLFIALFAFSFSVVLSVLWEIFEYAADTLVNTNMLQEGLKDTFEDLIAGVGVALLTSIIVLIYPRAVYTHYHPDP